MRKLTLLISIVVVFTLQTFAQSNESFLIKTDLKKITDLNKLEEIKLPVNHFKDDNIFSIVDKNKLLELDNANIAFEIIDQGRSSDTYFLLTSKNKKKEIKNPAYPNIVYFKDNLIIIKNLSSENSIVRDGFNIADMNSTEVFFKNEKLLFNSNTYLTDPEIMDVVSAVNVDSVRYFIQSLQDFQTRFLFANTKDAVADWIKNEFIRFGFTDVVIDSFLYQNTWQKNVVATLPGTIMPERNLVYGGHQDSYSSGDPMVFAPGADDNASGTAAALEMARVMKLKNYQPECTIKFITFAAEEYGLWGSKHYADNAFNSGMDIRLMINHDMISHRSVGAPLWVDINYYTGSEAFADLAGFSVYNYSSLTPGTGSRNSSGSDSYSFWQKGFNAVYFEEYDFSPYYHSPQDIITNNDMNFCSEVIKASGALLMTTNKIPSSVTNFKLYDPGNGMDIFANWNRNTEADFSHYRIYYGRLSYTDWEETTDTSYYLFVTTPDVNYNVAIVAVDNDGNESMMVERSITPRTIPMAPENLTAEPAYHSINLSWKKNQELDIVGYNIYRTTDPNGTFSLLNSQSITDTFFIDSSPSSGIYYYYKVKAVDNQSNESAESNVVKSRAVTLDNGILLIDETADGSGTFQNPTDEMVDEFYDQLLTGYFHNNFDIAVEGVPDLAALAPFSTIIWAGDDYSNYPASSEIISTLKQYLDYGGNLVYSGYRPTRLFGGASNNLNIFHPGSFVFDYLKIDSSLYSNTGRFKGSASIFEQYPDIYVDPVKTLPALNNHLIGIEAILPINEGNAIYKYDTDYDSLTNQGSLKGKPVGIEYIGSNYKTVILSFPLYYMYSDQAQSLLNYILNDRFGELTDTDDEPKIQLPENYSLNQNYPNPFNPTTKITWQTPESGWQTLKIYDVLGNEVAVLVNEFKPAGRYEIVFDASSLSSGVYIYKIQAGEYISSRKMILLK